jgi:hypothetical protein
MVPFNAGRPLRWLGAFPWNPEDDSFGRYARLLDPVTGGELQVSIAQGLDTEFEFGTFINVGLLLAQEEDAYVSASGRARPRKKVRLQLASAVAASDRELRAVSEAAA